MEEFDKIGIVGSRLYGDRKGSNPFFYGYEKGEKVTYSYTLDDNIPITYIRTVKILNLKFKFVFLFCVKFSPSFFLY